MSNNNIATKDIPTKLLEFYNRFKDKNTKFRTENSDIFNEFNEFTYGMDYDFYDISELLMYGRISNKVSLSKKMDYKRNKSLLKSILLNNTKSFRETVDILEVFIKFIETSLYDLHMNISTLHLDTNLKMLTYDEFLRITTLIETYYEEAFSTLKTVRNLSNLVTGLDQLNNIPNVQKDVLRRFYFNDVYSLKNNVRIFDKDNMIFGETNHIMHLFNTVFDYVFGSYIYVYKTIETIFENLNFGK